MPASGSAGRVDIRRAGVSQLPFADPSFDLIPAMALLRARYLTLDEHRAIFRAAGFIDIEIDHVPRKGWMCGIARRLAA
jgi:hypothetical protein